MKAIRKPYLVYALILFIVFFDVHSAHARITKEEKKTLKRIEAQYQDTREVRTHKALIALDDMLRLGALQNGKLKARFYAWKAAVADIAKAKSLDDPQLTFKTFIEEVETRVGPQKYGYGISQKFPFFGKRWTHGGIATDVSRQHYAAYQKTKLDLFYQITDAYLEYWYLHTSIAVTKENEKLLSRLEKVAQDKFRGSQQSNQDLLKVQVELGKIANDLLSLEDYKVPLVARLNALLHREADTFIGVPELDTFRYAELSSEEVLYKALAENNPDIEKANRRIEETHKKVRLAKLDYFPDISLGVDYIHVDDGPLNVADNGDDAMAVMVKVNVPLWFQKQAGQLVSAKSHKRSAHAAHGQLMRDLASQLQLLYFKLRDAEREIRLYKDALIPKTEQSVDAAEISYKSGSIDFLSLIEAERELLNFRLSYYRAMRDYEQTRAELEMILGQSLDEIKEGADDGQ